MKGEKTMAQFTLEELQAQRKTYWKELQTITLTLRGLEETLKEVRIQHKDALDNYSKVDYNLALIDGRAQRVAEAASAAKETTGGWKKRIKEPPSVSDLTQAQIDELLLELSPDSIHVVPEPQDVDLTDEEAVQLNMEEDLIND
jgi:hypothetical protein